MGSGVCYTGCQSSSVIEYHELQVCTWIKIIKEIVGWLIYLVGMPIAFVKIARGPRILTSKF
jgi:hypothetical protein